jgi:hypothetical protein
MNKNAIAVALSAAAYSMLFFDENAGINIFLFNLIVAGLFCWTQSNQIQEKAFLLALAFTLVSAFSILLHGSDLSVLANVVSLLILSSTSVSPKSSIIKKLVNAFCSVAISAVVSISQLFNRRRLPEGTSSIKFSGVITFLVPLFIAIIFLALYRQSNPLFEKLTNFICLDFITLDWVLFTLGGIYLCFGLFRNEVPDLFEKIEANLDTATDSADSSALWNEKKAFVILMLLLNVMALAINALDVSYLYIGNGLPEGVTHKQFVHNGVGNLILSIVLGVISLIYFLKRTERTLLIRVLVFLWIAQNAMIVVSTAMRNNLYIQDALLTYKRIGVYCWLLMAMLGLFAFVIKILKRKNTWQFIRLNAAIAWALLVGASIIDWDYFISLYNVSNKSIMASLDKKYLINISEGNIALLYSIRDQAGFNTDSVWHYHSWDNTANSKLLDSKLYKFLYENQNTNWRSYNFRRARVWREIYAVRESGQLRRMHLGSTYLPKTEEAMGFLNNTEWLELSHVPYDHEVKVLNTLPHLDSLSVRWINLDDTSHLRQLKNIRYLEHQSTYSLNVLMQKKVPGIVFKYIPEVKKVQ